MEVNIQPLLTCIEIPSQTPIDLNFEPKVGKHVRRLKVAISREVSMVDEPEHKMKVYQLQFTAEGLPKMILSKAIMVGKGNCSALLYNYGNSF
jgi:hypothetical protein